MKAINYIYVILLALTFVGCSEYTIDEIGLGNISGKVVEEGTYEPVTNARISTNPSSSTVFTDENGEFVLTDIPVEDYSVEARKDGLITQFQSASVLENVSVDVIFEMKKETSNNKRPSTPEAVFPTDNAQGVPITLELSWSASDPDEDDLLYSLEIRNDRNEEVLLYNNIRDTVFTIEGLDYNNKYFWQIRASDEVNEEVLSPLFSFETMQVPESRILYTRFISGNGVIFSANEDGDEFQLTSSSYNSFRPRKNNASNKIAFLRTVGGQTHLFTMNPDGSDQKQVTKNVPVNGFNLNQLDFSWSNEGASLVYPHFEKLYQIEASGGGTELIYETTNGKFITEVAVSKDNSMIALVTNNTAGYNSDLYTIDFNGNVLNQVLTDATGAVEGLDISVRNDLLLYVHDASEYENSAYRRLDSRIYLYSFATGESIDLSTEKDDGTNDLDPRFSPNEAEAIFVNTSNDGISRRDVYTMELVDSSEEDESGRTLFKENASMPDWE